MAVFMHFGASYAPRGCRTSKYQGRFLERLWLRILLSLRKVFKTLGYMSEREFSREQGFGGVGYCETGNYQAGK